MIDLSTITYFAFSFILMLLSINLKNSLKPKSDSIITDIKKIKKGYSNF